MSLRIDIKKKNPHKGIESNAKTCTFSVPSSHGRGRGGEIETKIYGAPEIVQTLHEVY